MSAFGQPRRQETRRGTSRRFNVRFCTDSSKSLSLLIKNVQRSRHKRNIDLRRCKIRLLFVLGAGGWGPVTVLVQ